MYLLMHQFRLQEPIKFWTCLVSTTRNLDVFKKKLSVFINRHFSKLQQNVWYSQYKIFINGYFSFYI